MKSGTTLMCKDKEVLSFDLDENLYDIHDEGLLPFQLKGRLHEMPEIKENMSHKELNRFINTGVQNNEALLHYFAGRVLPLTRENAKKIYSLFGFEQLQTDYAKSMIALSCRSVSLQDDYWIRNGNENEPLKTWKDVDIRQNHLNEIVAQVALHGDSLTLNGEGEICTPELNGHGAYAKAWIREDDGLYLYKLGSNGREEESRIEVMVSRILDKTNIPHIRYEDAVTCGKYACKCKCMTDEKTSMLSGLDFISYCNANGLDADKEIMEIDSDSIYKMWIVDYLISNRDRHGMNWGFYYNSNSMEIMGCHPLFDHNNAFDKALMYDKDAPYLYNRTRTMKESAEYAIKRTEIVLNDEITRDDFYSNDQYLSFKDRASDIGIDLFRGRYGGDLKRL